MPTPTRAAISASPAPVNRSRMVILLACCRRDHPSSGQPPTAGCATILARPPAGPGRIARSDDRLAALPRGGTVMYTAPAASTSRKRRENEQMHVRQLAKRGGILGLGMALLGASAAFAAAGTEALVTVGSPDRK